MTNRTVWVLLVLSIAFGTALLWASVDYNLPGNDEGYAPEQPINFSHRLHAGDMGIECLYCHSGAERSRHAGIPPLDLCMNCHKTVRAPVEKVRFEGVQAKAEGRSPRPIRSPEIAKIYKGLGLNDKGERDLSLKAEGVDWIKVNDLPDFVFFDHSRHVNASVSCTVCHGPVATMSRIRQTSDLSMGFCVNCHREVNEHGLAGDKTLHASVDCVVCHY